MFEFTLFVSRWGGSRTYRFDHTAEGWNISHIAINGHSAPDGAPILLANFEQDSVSYPSSLGSYLEHLWEQLKIGEITESDAQLRLQSLADWVSSCERSKPKWVGWNC